MQKVLRNFTLTQNIKFSSVSKFQLIVELKYYQPRLSDKWVIFMYRSECPGSAWTCLASQGTNGRAFIWLSPFLWLQHRLCSKFDSNRYTVIVPFFLIRASYIYLFLPCFYFYYWGNPFYFIYLIFAFRWTQLNYIPYKTNRYGWHSTL